MPRYRFDEIAINSKEKKKPVETDRFTYIGLEHLDSGNLKVSRYGADIAPIGEKLIMRQGDVLFAKRRAYQKKVAVAPFDGIFSAHGMVLRPKENIVDRNFFPLFISSDYFLDAAIKISVGSLSPTINWSDLRKLEFYLPDMDKQCKLAELLWSMVEAKEAYRELLRQTDELVKARFVEMFRDTLKYPLEPLEPVENPKGISYKSLQQLINDGWITYHLDGNHGGDYPRSEEFISHGVPYISANCIQDGKVFFDNAKYVTSDRAKRFRKGIAQNNDVLFAHNATVGPVAILHTEEPVIILGTSLTSYRCNKKYLLPEYLAAYMVCPAFTDQYEREMQQSTRKQVPITAQRKYMFLIPEIEQQDIFANLVCQADKAKSELTQAMNNLDVLYKRILNQELGA